MPHPKVDNRNHTESFSEQEVELYLERLSRDPKLKNTLIAALSQHALKEAASLHMPGHKGRLHLPGQPSVARLTEEFDVTELSGLDDLSYPSGVLQALEERIARLYGVEESIISVSGASGALLAAVMSVAKRGDTFLVPRNVHRSVVHALVLAGLKPRWYEPNWNAEWGIWQDVEADSVAEALAEPGDIAGLLVVSPTFAGAISDIKSIAQVAHAAGVPLIVDEAQGAHFFPSSRMPLSATQQGADLVVHSFHKTVGAMTQSGAVHVVCQDYVNAADLRASMRLVATSSPSYVLMASIEQAILLAESEPDRLERAEGLARRLRRCLLQKTRVYTPDQGFDPLHILIGSRFSSARQLDQFFSDRGIFAEAVLGSGCLFLLGVGTTEADIEKLEFAIDQLETSSRENVMVETVKPEPLVQVISPREAFFALSEEISLSQAAGRISADCLAPCPPGMAVCVPGARVEANHLQMAGLALDECRLRVLLDTNQ